MSNITYVEGVPERVVRVVPATDVPEGLRFVETASGEKVAVSKVALVDSALGPEVREYGANGQLLRTTLVRR